LVRIGFGAQFSTIPSVHWVVLIEGWPENPDASDQEMLMQSQFGSDRQFGCVQNG